MSNRLGGRNRGQSYLGTAASNPPNITYDDRRPTQFDSLNYSVGDFWIYQPNDPNLTELWWLSSLAGDPTSKGELAHWKLVGTGGQVAESFNTDFNGPVIPIADELNIVGGASIDAEAIALIYRQNIHTNGIGNTVQVKLNDSISLPNTTANGTQGVIYLGGVAAANRFISNFGNQNTFIGIGSGNFTLTGSFNAALGSGTGSALTTGSSNMMMGVNCGTSLTTGIDNLAIGSSALNAATTGLANVSLGASSLLRLVSGIQNIAIGTQAGQNYKTNESGNIILNTSGIEGESNTLRIGSGTGGLGQELNRAFISGIRGITTDNADAIAVLIDSAGQLGTVSSSIRFKENIKDMGVDSSVLMQLRPVSFNFKDKKDKSYGLIAEEVERICPHLVVNDEFGLPLSVKYHDLPAMLLNELQKLRKEIDELKNKIK